MNRDLYIPPVRRAQLHVAREFGITVEELVSPARRRKVAWPRFVAMDLAHRILGVSLGKTARFFGRDRSTVRHALRMAAELSRRDAALAERVRRIEAALLGMLGIAAAIVMVPDRAQAGLRETSPCITLASLETQLAIGGIKRPIVEMVSYEGRRIEFVVNARSRHWALIATDWHGCARVVLAGPDWDGGLAPEETSGGRP